MELQRAHHDLRLTQLLLGHADIRSTARYAQLDTADLAAALEALHEGATSKCSNPKTRFAGKVEAAGIEPANDSDRDATAARPVAHRRVAPVDNPGESRPPGTVCVGRWSSRAYGHWQARGPLRQSP
jgi:hypothetical protein